MLVLRVVARPEKPFYFEVPLAMTLDLLFPQEIENLSLKFVENMDATKKFEKLITNQNDIEGLPATAIAMGCAESCV